MPDIQPTTAEPRAQDSSLAAPSDSEPLSHLFKMSTTSAGGQEYVAINSAAIAALLLGVASVLGMASPVFLIVPLAGLISGAMALIQIRGSNGTQAGRALAWIGVGLALLFAGIKVGIVGRYWIEDRADARQVLPLVERLSADVHTRRYDEAYEDLFSSAFRRRVDRKTFADNFEQFINSPNFGLVQSIEWNGQHMDFGEIGTSGVKAGNAMAVMRFPRSSLTMRPVIIFSTRDGPWKIDSIDLLFPDRTKATIQ